MKYTTFALLMAVLAVGGCAAFDAFRATPEGHQAIDNTVAGVVAIGSAIIPPPWNALLITLGGIVGGLAKKDPPE